MNLGEKAKQVLRTVAPVLGTAIGGPFGTMAGALVSAALGTTQGDEKAAEAALLAAGPDTIVALRKADQDFAVRMKELGIEESKLVFDDIASARQMQVSTRDPTAARLAWLVIGGFIGLSVVMVIAFMAWPERVSKIEAAAWTLLTSVITFLAAEAKQAGAFYFGSSQSSRDKDATLSEIAKMP